MTISAVETPTPAPGAPSPTPSPVEPTPQDWRLQIPEDLRADKSLAQVKDIPSLAKGYVEAQRLVGGSIRLPKADAPPEERQKFLEDIWGKLGRPADAKGYEIGEPENLPEGLPWDMGVQTEFLGQAHKLGLTRDQALGVLEWYGERYVDASMKGRVSREEAVETMRREWGANAEANMELARRAVNMLGGDKAKQTLVERGLANDPDLIRLFAKVGRMLAEHKLISGTVEGIPTPEDAKAKIQAIRSDPNHLYHEKFAGKPGHTEAVEEMKRLYELAHPSAL